MSVSSTLEVIPQFKQAMYDRGIRPPEEIVPDGELHRFPTKEGYPNDQAGYYVLYTDGVAAGAFGCWRRDIHVKWSLKNYDQMDKAEQRDSIEKQNKIKKAKEKEANQRKNEARKRANKLWNKAGDASSSNPYLQKKGVGAYGVKEINDTLIVPLRDGNGDIWTVEMIFSDGTKRFLKGGKKSGCYHSIGNIFNNIVYVAEGYATGASIHECTGHAVAIAMDSNNLKSVCEILRKKMPQISIIVCGDNDSHEQGFRKSVEAAKTINGYVTVPPEEGDWNDVHQQLGIQEVNRLISSVCYRELPDIYIRSGRLSETISHAREALSKSGLQIYNRGGQLVRPVRVKTTSSSSSSIRRSPDTLSIIPVDSTWLRIRMNETANWYKFYAKTSDWHPVDPPKEIAESIHRTPDEGDWPHLSAIVHHPVLWKNGQWTNKGYINGVLIDTKGDRWIEPGSTYEEAMQALKKLRSHLRYMPWESQNDESVGLSLLMTSVMRAVIPTNPMHVVDAPTPGTGKSMLVNVAAILATGNRASVMDYGKDSEEAAKRLDSMLLAGDSIIAIDNIETAVEGATLCQTLTEESRRVRVLGESTVVTVPCTSLITATGNNVTLKGDIVRRSVICRLNAKSERPDKREIDQDLIKETYEKREELIYCIQTIIRAYLYSNNKNVGLIPVASFEEWSKIIRNSLVWSGMPDPIAKTDQAMEDDPLKQTTKQMFKIIHRKYANLPITAKKLIEDAGMDDDLHDALTPICMRKGSLNVNVLGYWLRNHKDVCVEGLTLQKKSVSKGVAQWVMVIEKGENKQSEETTNKVAEWTL